MILAWSIFAYVVLARLAELWLAQRNTRALLAQGAVEIGAGHYPVMVLLHASWLGAIALWLIFVPSAVSLSWLVLFAVLQVLRVWVLATLGRFWTTRIVSLPGAPLVRRGPYRFLRHPNYWVVVGEIAVLPLVFDAWAIALAWSVLNGLMLRHRIGIEEAALAKRV